MQIHGFVRWPNGVASLPQKKTKPVYIYSTLLSAKSSTFVKSQRKSEQQNKNTMLKRSVVNQMLKDAFPDTARLNVTAEALGQLGLNSPMVSPMWVARMLYYASSQTGHRVPLVEKISALEEFHKTQPIENNPVLFITMLIAKASTADIKNLMIDCSTGLCVVEMGEKSQAPAKVVRFPLVTMEPVELKAISKMVMIPGSFINSIYKAFHEAEQAEKMPIDEFEKVLNNAK